MKDEYAQRTFLGCCCGLTSAAPYRALRLIRAGVYDCRVSRMDDLATRHLSISAVVT